MRHLRLLILVVMMLPMVASAQQKGTAKSKATKTTQTSKAAKSKAVEVDNYPNFNLTEAAAFWKQWRDKVPFTQDDYKRVIEMCNIGFDYLIADLDNVQNTIDDPKVRTNAFRRIVDEGKSSDMNLFCRSFSTRMLTIALENGLDDNNKEIHTVMQDKKKTFKAIVDYLEHPETAPKVVVAANDSISSKVQAMVVQ